MANYGLGIRRGSLQAHGDVARVGQVAGDCCCAPVEVVRDAFERVGVFSRLMGDASADNLHGVAGMSALLTGGLCDTAVADSGERLAQRGELGPQLCLRSSTTLHVPRGGGYAPSGVHQLVRRTATAAVDTSLCPCYGVILALHGSGW